MNDILTPVLAEHLSRQLSEFAASYDELSSRERIVRLVEIQRSVRNLGKRLSKDFKGPRQSARSRILTYFKAHSGLVIEGDELAIVAGISEYARRIRELRAEGWNIVAGTDTNKQRPQKLKPDQYLYVPKKRQKFRASGIQR